MKNLNIPVENIKHFLNKGLLQFVDDVNNVHLQLFVKENETLALTFLSQANSFVNSLKSLMLLSDDFDRYELTDFVVQFDTFNKEVKSSVSTNRSHQWSDIEYRKLLDKVIPIAEMVDIDKSTFEID